MKKLAYLLTIMIAIAVASCVPQSDTAQAPQVNYDTIVAHWFRDFQTENPEWVKTPEINVLAKAFEEKMVSDLNFAIACTRVTGYDDGVGGFGSVIKDKSLLCSYTMDGSDEYGETLAFQYVLQLQLEKPLPSGGKDIYIEYEIVNNVPATIENHDYPYIDSVNVVRTNEHPIIETRHTIASYMGSYFMLYDRTKE